jgi:hypothetical protein
MPLKLLRRCGVMATVCLLSLAWAPARGQTETITATTATRDEINLNGAWTFTPHDGGLNPGVAASIRVPDAWDALPGFYDATSATYQRTVAVPAGWAGRDVVLELYEANWHVDLTVNGVVFPRVSEGIGIPTNIDITSAVQFGANNTLQIRVTAAGRAYAANRPAGTFRWGQNLGLTGDVFLRSYPKVRVADAFVKTYVRPSNSITVQYELVNRAGGTRTLSVEPRVLELNGTPVLTLPTQQASVGGATVPVAIASAWANPQLWTPADPHLYYLETTLRENGNVVDVQRVRFGFREVWTQGTEIFLNGVPVVLFTDSNDLFQHAFMNYYYQLWYDEAATRATAAKLKAQRNAIRIHQAPAVRPHVLEVFDELGILVIGESAVYGGSFTRGQGLLAGQSQSEIEGVQALAEPQALSDYIANALPWIDKWVRRERNHPSIVIWSAENELGPGWLNQNTSQLQQLGDRVRASDNTRPVIFEGDHTCCGSNFNSYHYNQDGPGGDWPANNDVYAYALKRWLGGVPHSQNEYAFTGWNGNGIFQATDGSNPTNLTSLQGTRLRSALLTRGYRFQGWATFAPHTFVWQWADLYGPEGRIEDQFVARSFAPVAAFDVEYDRLGENPAPPVIPAGSTSFTRNVVVYNQEYAGSDAVTLQVRARADGNASPFFTFSQGVAVPRGRKVTLNATIQNLPAGSHWVQLEYVVIKDGVERFAGETRDFQLDGADATAPAAPGNVRAFASGGPMGVLDRNMVYLTWEMPNPRGDVQSWVISRGTSANPTGQEDEVKLWGETEKFDFHNEYFDVVPGPGTYYYRVRAKDLKGNLSEYSAQAVVTVTDYQTPLRDPGFEMESRLYKNASNQYYGARTWGEGWPLPAILGGARVAPHGGRFAGLVNGDGAHAENAFVDKFQFIQRAPRTSGAFHVGAYVKIEKVWRGRDLNEFIRPGLRLAVVGGDGTGYFYNPRQEVLVDVPTLRAWEGDGQWHYIYFTMSNPPADNDSNFEIVVRDGEGDADWREPLLDAYVDDITLAPTNKIPPAALATANKPSAYTIDTIVFDAASSFGFNSSGGALAPNTGLTYAWDLGNGQTATGPTAQTVYTTPGEYVARVTVTDSKGLSSTANVYVTVALPPDRKTVTPQYAAQGQTVTFSMIMVGTGEQLTLTDVLPQEFDYVSHNSSCGGASYNSGSRTLTVSATPASGAVCTIDLAATINTVQIVTVTNTATLMKGTAQPINLSASVGLNYKLLFMPLIRK